MLQRRYVYVLLFAVPALLLSTIVAAVLLAASAGALWLFVYGDDPWPPVANTLLGGVFVLSTVALSWGLLSAAYAVGKQQEARPSMNARHIALSIGATIVLVALVAARLSGLSIPGARSDSSVCADVCQAQGSAASSMPPRNSGDRTCTCLDAEGREVRQIVLP